MFLFPLKLRANMPPIKEPHVSPSWPKPPPSPVAAFIMFLSLRLFSHAVAERMACAHVAPPITYLMDSEKAFCILNSFIYTIKLIYGIVFICATDHP
jgi:hypothetical protein